MNVQLADPDDRKHELGTWEVVRPGPMAVWGNNAASGWALLARWDDEAEGWRASEDGELFADLYIY